MKYTESDLKVGAKLLCTKAVPEYWTVGKVYEVSLGKNDMLVIKDDDENVAFTRYMLRCLNGSYAPVQFEIIKEGK